MATSPDYFKADADTVLSVPIEIPVGVARCDRPVVEIDGVPYCCLARKARASVPEADVLGSAWPELSREIAAHVVADHGFTHIYQLEAVRGPLYGYVPRSFSVVVRGFTAVKT